MTRGDMLSSLLTEDELAASLTPEQQREADALAGGELRTKRYKPKLATPKNFVVQLVEGQAVVTVNHHGGLAQYAWRLNPETGKLVETAKPHWVLCPPDKSAVPTQGIKSTARQLAAQLLKGAA